MSNAQRPDFDWRIAGAALAGLAVISVPAAAAGAAVLVYEQIKGCWRGQDDDVEGPEKA